MCAAVVNVHNLPQQPTCRHYKENFKPKTNITIAWTLKSIGIATLKSLCYKSIKLLKEKPVCLDDKGDIFLCRRGRVYIHIHNSCGLR